MDNNAQSVNFTQKQSNGYLNVQLLSLQLMFLLLYILVISLSLEGGNALDIGILKLGEVDISFILAGIITQLLFSLFLFVRWNRTTYRIHNHHLIITSGVINAESRSIALSDIISPYTKQSLLGTYYGYGTVELAIRFSNEPIYLPGVPNPEHFIETLRHSTVKEKVIY